MTTLLGTEIIDPIIPSIREVCEVENEDIIGSATSLEEIVDALARRGCPDLTLSIHLAACSDFPCAGGGFCDVYRGALHDGVSVAIKALRVYDGPEAKGDGDRQKILKHAARELYHWSKLQHNNVLPLMGLAIFRGYISMVSKWMENGSLISYLRLNPGANRARICMDICLGLHYIHMNEMVHGDMKAANVMISPDGTAMIADFGNSELKDLTLRFTNTTRRGLSVRWAAPELLLENSGPQVSKEADVYAYGMTVLETVTGKVPYEGISDNRVICLVAYEKELPPRPDIGISDELWDILKLCWTREPSRRPQMFKIKSLLQLVQPSDTWLPEGAGPRFASSDQGVGQTSSRRVPGVVPAYTNYTPPSAPGSSSGSRPNVAGGQWKVDQSSPHGLNPTNLAANSYETTNEAAVRRAGPPLQPALPSSISNNALPVSEAYSDPEYTPTIQQHPFKSEYGSNTLLTTTELPRSLIRFYLAESGQPTTAVNWSVVNVATCQGGAQVIKQVLKKFNKHNAGKSGMVTDDEHTDETENGGLIVGGWGLFPGGPQNDPTGGPLSEAEILAICHADVKHPTREQGLTLRNVRKLHSQTLANSFAETPPPYTIGPKLQTQDEGGVQLTPSSLKFPTSATPGSSKQMDRARTTGIIPILGVEPPSPGGTPDHLSASGSRKKLHNFFGQRPLSKLIASHLPEIFPSTSRKFLQRTARNSLLRANLERDSQLFIQADASTMAIKEDAVPPRMSAPTNDGRSIDISTSDTKSTGKSLDRALPPLPVPGVSLPDSLGTGSSAIGIYQSQSNAYKRVGVVFKRGRDKSDTANPLTDDEVAAELERCRRHMQNAR